MPVTATPRPNEEILEMLSAAPERLARATASLSPELLVTEPAAGEWSARHILGHLRACADMWGGSIARILKEDRPTFKAVNPGTWIRQTDYLEQEFAPSLHAFTAQREELLTMLRALAPVDWQRSATVTVAGKPLERTVYFYAHWLATHERTHIRQIERVARELSAALDDSR